MVIKMKMLQKTTFREIRGTFGRFFAILAIIALGVGFFTGVRITTPAMVHAVNTFLQGKQFYDYRLVSTLGWEEEDVEAFQQQEDVRYAEGANTADVLFLDEEENEIVLKVHSLPENINQIQLEEGRMPENAQECLIDAAYTELSIGDKISISEMNEEDTTESFKEKNFTIVGTAYTSYYLNYERGTTSIGTGNIDGYLYVLEESFDLEYYSEIFIRFNQDEEIYSEAYKEYMNQKLNFWENLTQEQAEKRYTRLVNDAETELQDGKEELSDKRKDGEKELADAKQELDDAEKELADGQTELDDAQKQLTDAKTELDDGEKELSDAKQELDDAEQELNDAKTELDNGNIELENARQQLEDSEQQLTEAKAQLDSGWEEWNTSQQQLQAGQQQLQVGQNQLDTAKQQLTQTKTELNAQEILLNQKQAEFAQQSEQLLAMWEYLPEEQKQAYQAGKAELESAQTQLETAKAQVSDGMQEIQAQQAELDQKKQELEAGLTALAEGKAKLEAGQAEYEAGLQQYEEGKEAYESALIEYNAGKKAYQDGLQEFEDGKKSYEEGLQEYQEGKQEYEDGLKDYQDGLAEYEDGEKKYQDGKKEYQDGLQEFEEKISDAEQEISDAEKEISEIEKPDTYVLDRETNIGYACFESDSEIVEQVAKVFPIFFILVAALVCMTTMSRMVEEQRTQIGTLKALGYSEISIMGKFTFYSGSAAVIGCILGYAVGTALFPQVIWMSYQLMYMPMNVEYLFDGKLALLSLGAALLCSVGTTWISCRYELAETSASLMRPKAPKAGKRVIFEYFPFFWNRLKFLHKVSIRNIFRYKGRFFMMVIGIGGCTALLLTGFGLKDSVAGFADVQYGEIQVADAEASLKSGMGTELPENLKTLLSEQTEEYIPLHQSSWDLVTKEKVKSMTVMMPFGEMNHYMNFRTPDGEELAFPEVNEAIISNSISERFGVNIGDEITLRNEDMQEMHVNVTGIFENHVYYYIFIQPETVKAQLNETPEYNTIYMNFPENADIYQNSAEIAKNEKITLVTLFQDSAKRLDKMMESLNYIVLLVIVCAAGLAFIVLYNLTNINITERIREIATIKVLGFFRKETSAYVLRENVTLTAIGIIAGLILGIFLHRFVMSQIIVDMVSFKVRILPMSFLYSIALTFLFNFMVNLFMEVKLEKINMAESLKSVD